MTKGVIISSAISILYDIYPVLAYMFFLRNFSLFAIESIFFNGTPLLLGYVNPKATNFSDLFSLYIYIYALRYREFLYKQNLLDEKFVVDLTLKHSFRLLKFPSLYFL